MKAKSIRTCSAGARVLAYTLEMMLNNNLHIEHYKLGTYFISRGASVSVMKWIKAIVRDPERQTGVL